MIRLESIRVSGQTIEFDSPILIDGTESLVLTGNGEIVWATTGRKIKLFAVEQPDRVPSHDGLCGNLNTENE